MCISDNGQYTHLSMDDVLDCSITGVTSFSKVIPPPLDLSMSTTDTPIYPGRHTYNGESTLMDELSIDLPKVVSSINIITSSDHAQNVTVRELIIDSPVNNCGNIPTTTVGDRITNRNTEKLHNSTCICDEVSIHTYKPTNDVLIDVDVQTVVAEAQTDATNDRFSSSADVLMHYDMQQSSPVTISTFTDIWMSMSDNISEGTHTPHYKGHVSDGVHQTDMHTRTGAAADADVSGCLIEDYQRCPVNYRCSASDDKCDVNNESNGTNDESCEASSVSREIDEYDKDSNSDQFITNNDDTNNYHCDTSKFMSGTNYDQSDSNHAQSDCNIEQSDSIHDQSNSIHDHSDSNHDQIDCNPEQSDSIHDQSNSIHDHSDSDHDQSDIEDEQCGETREQDEYDTDSRMEARLNPSWQAERLNVNVTVDNRSNSSDPRSQELTLGEFNRPQYQSIQYVDSDFELTMHLDDIPQSSAGSPNIVPVYVDEHDDETNNDGQDDDQHTEVSSNESDSPVVYDSNEPEVCIDDDQLKSVTKTVMASTINEQSTLCMDHTSTNIIHPVVSEESTTPNSTNATQAYPPVISDVDNSKTVNADSHTAHNDTNADKSLVDLTQDRSTSQPVFTQRKRSHLGTEDLVLPHIQPHTTAAAVDTQANAIQSTWDLEIDPSLLVCPVEQCAMICDTFDAYAKHLKYHAIYNTMCKDLNIKSVYKNRAINTKLFGVANSARATSSYSGASGNESNILVNTQVLVPHTEVCVESSRCVNGAMGNIDIAGAGASAEQMAHSKSNNNNANSLFEDMYASELTSHITCDPSSLVNSQKEYNQISQCMITDVQTCTTLSPSRRSVEVPVTEVWCMSSMTPITCAVLTDPTNITTPKQYRPMLCPAPPYQDRAPNICQQAVRMPGGEPTSPQPHTGTQQTTTSHNVCSNVISTQGKETVTQINQEYHHASPYHVASRPSNVVFQHRCPFGPCPYSTHVSSNLVSHMCVCEYSTISYCPFKGCSYASKEGSADIYCHMHECQYVPIDDFSCPFCGNNLFQKKMLLVHIFIVHILPNESRRELAPVVPNRSTALINGKTHALNAITCNASVCYLASTNATTITQAPHAVYGNNVATFTTTPITTTSTIYIPVTITPIINIPITVTTINTINTRTPTSNTPLTIIPTMYIMTPTTNAQPTNARSISTGTVKEQLEQRIQQSSIYVKSREQRVEQSSIYLIPSHNEQSSICVTPAAQQSGQSSICVTPAAQQSGQSSICVTPAAQQSGQSSIFVTPTAQQSGQSSICVTPTAQQSGQSSICVTPTAQQSGQSSICVTPTIQQNEQSSIYVTQTIQHSGQSSICVTPTAQQSGQSSICVTPTAQQKDQSSICVTPTAQHSGQSSICVTPTAQQKDQSSIYVTPNTQQCQQSSICVTPTAQQSGQSSICVTPTAQQKDQSSICVTPTAQHSGQSSICVTPTAQQKDQSSIYVTPNTQQCQQSSSITTLMDDQLNDNISSLRKRMNIPDVITISKRHCVYTTQSIVVASSSSSNDVTNRP